MLPRLIRSGTRQRGRVRGLSISGDVAVSLLAEGDPPIERRCIRVQSSRDAADLGRTIAGTFVEVAVGPDGQIATISEGESRDTRVISTWRAGERHPAAVRYDERQAWSICWLDRDRLLIGLYDQPWTESAGPKVELWDASLTTRLGQLDVNDAGYDLAAARGLVAARGIDLHLWVPDSDAAAFCLHDQLWAPHGEAVACALSENACRVAVAHDRWWPKVDQVWILDVHNPCSYVAIRDETTTCASHVSLSADGQLLALRLQETERIRVHDANTSDLLVEWDVPGLEVLRFHGNRRLVVGADALSIWEL